MLMYNVTRRKPFGTEYHGPGSARNRYTLSLYHLANGFRGRVQDAMGWNQREKRRDIDVMFTLDDVPVVNHSLDAMSKEGFRADGVPHRTIDQLTWEDVKKLRTPDGYRIAHLRWALEELVRDNKIGAIDMKGLWNERRMDIVTKIANEEKAWVYFKATFSKRHHRWTMKWMRKRGYWGRYNNTPTFLAPLD